MNEKIWLLILGFVLTTVLGGVLGYLLKQRSWQIETEHSFHKTRYEEGVKFLDGLSDQTGRRFFLLQRYLWAIEEGDKKKVFDLEKEYFASVLEWNSSFWRNRNRIRLLASEEQASAFLSYNDDTTSDHPKSLHYKFVAAHRAVINAKDSRELIPIAKRQVEELNWMASVFIERLTTEFLQRAIKLQLLEVPLGPGAAEQAAPLVLSSTNNAPEQQLQCSLGSSQQSASGWCVLERPTDFRSGERLKVVVGGTARQILVRLLPRGVSLDTPTGIIGGPRRVPANRTVEVVLESDYSTISQILVHGGPNPWGVSPLGENNGPATIISIKRLGPQRR